MSAPKEKITGASLLIESLKKQGVRHIFEYPGGSTAPILDEIYRQGEIRSLVSKHEQGAAHAADGYARASGKVGVCMGTSGPGSSNLITGITNAYMDSIPMVAITGQVATWDMKGNAKIRQKGFQELSITELVKPVTKLAKLVTQPQDIPSAVDEAFFVATEGRPGPVLLDLPINVQYTEVKEDIPQFLFPKSSSCSVSKDIGIGILERLKKSERPLIVIGGGVLLSHMSQEVFKWVRELKIPVVETMMGLDAISSSWELNLGMIGYAGSEASHIAVKEADCILVLGSRMDNRAFPLGQNAFGENVCIIRVDIDTHELHQGIKSEISIASDLRHCIPMLIQLSSQSSVQEFYKKKWIERIRCLKEKNDYLREKSESVIKPFHLLEELSSLLESSSALIATDVGQHQLWAAQFFRFLPKHSFISSGGLGTMGFGLPAAIGAQVAKPDSLVVLITSEGSLQMNIQELATITNYELPIKIINFNNRSLGLIRQLQDLAFGGRYQSTVDRFQVDFCALAKAYQLEAVRIAHPAEIRPKLKEILFNKKATLVDVAISFEENVRPIFVKGKIWV